MKREFARHHRRGQIIELSRPISVPVTISEAISWRRFFCCLPKSLENSRLNKTSDHAPRGSPLAPVPSRAGLWCPRARAHVTGINDECALLRSPHPYLTLCGPPNWLTPGPIAMDPEIIPRSAQLSPHVASLTWQCAWLGSRQRLPPRPPPASCRGRDPPWPQRPRPRQWP